MLDEKTLTQFGITLDDELPHAYSENHADWNESYFFDWYDELGENAGHCRIGWHPVQKRVLFWLYLFNGSEWLIIEEYRLPFSELRLGATRGDQAFSYTGWGLNFSYQPSDMLSTGTLKVSGFARVACGSRQCQVLPVQVALVFEAQGAVHSRGAGTVENHSAKGFSTNRYEQPIKADAVVNIGAEKYTLSVRGERDHSWGPRPWDMHWQFFVLNNEQFSLQCTEVHIPEWPLIQIGYFQSLGEQMDHLQKVEFNLEFNADDPMQAVSGSFNFVCESGRQIQGRMETISGMEIDITHTFAQPKRTEYRRSLVRCYIDGAKPTVGWLECNRPANA